MNLKTNTKTALIDLELISYSHAAKAESTGTGLKSLVEMVEFTIQSVVSACRAQKHYLVVSGRNNFRKVLYPDYKAGRREKPPLYAPLMDKLEELNRSRWCKHDQLEADDLLGIMLTNGRVKNPILCSIDKDLLGVPGWHYNWNKDDWPREVTQGEADHHWLVQLLMGDSTDNIEGMKGIGIAKAEKLVAAYYEKTGVFNAPVASAKEIYESEGFSLDAYTKCLMLASIWRAPMPPELLENELISEVVKTIPSL
jgi:5'-3' exonuclease